VRVTKSKNPPPLPYQLYYFPDWNVIESKTIKRTIDDIVNDIMENQIGFETLRSYQKKKNDSTVKLSEDDVLFIYI
jgi:hypothetical protein